ncbi:non-canonical purine NTP diphosphatase [Bacteroidales bacterium OttesenSCG-928-C19]|nr:non-canonical purine NTP diphosphatase [Bacteroidales bacterium OttesenSCG-928-C19]
MRKIVFATNNKHKLEEIGKMLKGVIEIAGLSDIGFSGDIPETADTLEGNAAQKAHYIYDRYGLDCFADDTGLEVDALDGAPGVYSARYAGEHCSFEDNMNKLLNALSGKESRNARFRTVICLIEGGKETFFEGEVQGSILKEKRGGEGFGYDPIFQPNGFSTSFAEMNLEDKNKISHRGRATQKLIEYLRRHQGNN